MRPIIYAVMFFWLWPSFLCGQLTKETKSYEPGSLVVLQPEIGEGARWTWDLRYPETFEAYAEADSKLFIAMPRHAVAFTLIIVPNDTTKPLRTIRYTIKPAKIPDPDDDDPVKPDPIDPIPDPRPSVKNDYWVGLAAYENAPKDGLASKLAKVYRQSAEYLSGNPPKKALFFENDADNRNPDKSVLAWQRQEAEKITGRNADWVKWSKKVNEAFREAQVKLPRMTRVEWAGAFNEVAEALEAVE